MSEPSSGQVRSVLKAIDLLEQLAAESRGLGLAELAKRTGLNRSSSHHLVATLRSRGFIDQDPETREYRLGHRLISLVHEFVSDSDIYSAGVGPIRELREASGANALLTVLQAREKFVIFEVVGEHPVQTRRPHQVGRTHFHASASGKTMLAFMPPATTDAMLGDGPLVRYTPNTIADPAALRAELAAVREQGYALDHEEWLVGLFGIAAPIFDRHGVCVATASVAFPAVQAAERRDANVRLVRACAAKVSAALGFVDSASAGPDAVAGAEAEAVA